MSSILLKYMRNQASEENLLNEEMSKLERDIVGLEMKLKKLDGEVYNLRKTKTVQDNDIKLLQEKYHLVEPEIEKEAEALDLVKKCKDEYEKRVESCTLNINDLVLSKDVIDKELKNSSQYENNVLSLLNSIQEEKQKIKDIQAEISELKEDDIRLENIEAKIKSKFTELKEKYKISPQLWSDEDGERLRQKVFSLVGEINHQKENTQMSAQDVLTEQQLSEMISTVSFVHKLNLSEAKLKLIGVCSAADKLLKDENTDFSETRKNLHHYREKIASLNISLPEDLVNVEKLEVEEKKKLHELEHEHKELTRVLSKLRT
eukprot:snap_masked-scaffold_36-processed-gene-2.60-mRNA-1 protein AED:1.00 eAED:1.00 QI:0/-1/0/0/-1/1/1/0/317